LPRKSAPASAVGGFPPTTLIRTYVWEKPVRVAHWLIVFSILALSFTGIYIHSPFHFASGRPVFTMATMRFAHEVAGFVLIGAMALRIYWFFKGNLFARWSAYVPIHRRQWEGIGSMLEFYLFLRFLPGRRAGHNPLAALSYAVIYLLILVEILTGLALYTHVSGNAVLHEFFGWLPRLVNISYIRLTHYFLMFVFFAFTLFHVYASILVSLEEENGLLDSIFSGWKFMPASDLRQEIAEIPEARTFVRRHQLLPRSAAPHVDAGRPRPGPGPRVLYRNWISYIGTGIAAVGVLVFAVLTLYHTVGGGWLSQPYGDLVIFFVPPVFVIIGVVVLLAGMYLEWLRWRMNKPLSFSRYPKWDLNVPAERKALLAVTLGAAVIAVPAIYGSYQAYAYTDAVSFCGTLCHSMTPEYMTYQYSPHARVSCAQCHVGPGALGYIASKVRGLVELQETIQDNYPRPIPAPVSILRPVRGNCETCHWPSHFFGSHLTHREHFLSDEQNTRWDISMAMHIGGGESPRPSVSERTIHWHVTSKVEYVATDTEHQNIVWVRSVDRNTGVSNVYTSQPQPGATAPPGEVRTMDCVDCHNRPSHLLYPPDRAVDLALSSGRISASLPFVKQQSVAALTGTYATTEEAMSGIDNALHVFYQQKYPAIYAARQREINAAVQALREIYTRSFFPSMKVRWDTYVENSGHFHFAGCNRCHDGQHKSVDGTAIRSDCNSCHTILQQGKPGSMEVAKGAEGLNFVHPVDIGNAWAESPCSSCHTGGSM
jgi:Ni/Fe-hydrogenase b-type cytochrome subunit